MKQEQLMDKRVLRTQKRLRESMLQLLEEQHYNDISVKDICEASGVSRALSICIIKIKKILL